MGKWNILVTPAEACAMCAELPQDVFGDFDLVLTHGRVADPKHLHQLLLDKDGVVLDIEPITKSVLRDCQNLRVISRFGEGCDRIDFVACKQRAIRVTRTRGAGTMAVARHALALILALTHHLIENDRNLKLEIWSRQENMSDNQLTVGIVGWGQIGQALASMLKAVGFEVLVLSRGDVGTAVPKAVDLYDLIAKSNIVSLHLPVDDTTRQIISAKVLSGFQGRFLVNTARGALVDEEAVFQALNGGSLAGYATDVFVKEPPTGISAHLAAHPKVVCSPHVAALDRWTAARMTRQALENVLWCLNGRPERVVAFADHG